MTPAVLIGGAGVLVNAFRMRVCPNRHRFFSLPKCGMVVRVVCLSRNAYRFVRLHTTASTGPPPKVGSPRPPAVFLALPNTQVGDVVLVEKVSRASVVRRDDIVFFTPPPVLREVVSSAGGALNPSDLFVKRVAGLAGDTVTVNADGSVDVRPPPPRTTRGWLPQSGRRGGGAERNAAASPEARDGSAGVGTEMPQGESGGVGASGASGRERGPAKAALPDSVLQRITRVDGKVLDGAFVLGDNPAASMDSRVWGQLDEREIVGHALLRVLPPRSFGLLR